MSTFQALQGRGRGGIKVELQHGNMQTLPVTERPSLSDTHLQPVPTSQTLIQPSPGGDAKHHSGALALLRTGRRRTPVLSPDPDSGGRGRTPGPWLLTWCGSSECSHFYKEPFSFDTKAADLLWQRFL